MMHHLLKEMQEHGVDILKTTGWPTANFLKKMLGPCTWLRYPTCTLTLITSTRSTITFQEWVKSGLIKILPINTKEQHVDLLTKPLDVWSLEDGAALVTATISNSTRECDYIHLLFGQSFKGNGGQMGNQWTLNRLQGGQSCGRMENKWVPI
jgi:hypothetical protein